MWCVDVEWEEDDEFVTCREEGFPINVSSFSFLNILRLFRKTKKLDRNPVFGGGRWFRSSICCFSQ